LCSLKFLLAAAVAAAEVVDAEAEVSVAVVAACVPVADSRHRAACRVPLVQAWARGRVDYQEALEPARLSVPALAEPTILPADDRPLVNSAIS